MTDHIIYTVAKLAAADAMEKDGYDSNDFLFSVYQETHSYGTFHGEIFYIGGRNKPRVVGSYCVLIIQGEFFPEASDAEVNLSDNQILSEVII